MPKDAFKDMYSPLITIPTSDANAKRFFSPPEIPRSLPGTPMTVSAHFFKPS